MPSFSSLARYSLTPAPPGWACAQEEKSRQVCAFSRQRSWACARGVASETRRASRMARRIQSPPCGPGRADNGVARNSAGGYGSATLDAMLLPAGFTPLWTPAPETPPSGYWFVLHSRALLVTAGEPDSPAVPRLDGRE